MDRNHWLDALDAVGNFAGKWLAIFIGFSFLAFCIADVIILYVYPGENRVEPAPHLDLVANILFPARLVFDGVEAFFLGSVFWGAVFTLLFALRRRLALHFSLRTLLIATTLFAVVLGLAVWAGR